VRNWVISMDGVPADKNAPRVAVYPASEARNAYQDTVVKAFFSKPVRGVNSNSFMLTDSHGKRVPAWVDQIGDGVWGLFPDPVLLKPGESYTARLRAGVCDLNGDCTKQDIVWKFTVCKEAGQGTGDTSIPAGFVVPDLHSKALRTATVRQASGATVRMASK